MNGLVVLQTAQVRTVDSVDEQGLCEYLIETFGSQVYERGIVVGYSIPS